MLNNCGGFMKNYLIYCDDLQEGMWFKNLSHRFDSVPLEIIPSNRKVINSLGLDKVLKYDRPDIILMDNNKIIFVLERTVEVPSGHNVGQRYGRLLAAAEERIPVVYFGPYAAYKHGGNTAGPRYMNLRLFYSLNNVSRNLDTAITTINWPVDSQYEVLRTPSKDDRIKEYLDLFFAYYDKYGFNGLTEYINHSKFQQEQIAEQVNFANTEINDPEQYDVPPDSVEIIDMNEFLHSYGLSPCFNKNIKKVILYHVGMTYIRSDPYTGMSALYKNLYGNNSNVLILDFANIDSSKWYAQRKSSKTYRMYKEFADGILFANSFVLHDAL